MRFMYITIGAKILFSLPFCAVYVYNYWGKKSVFPSILNLELVSCETVA